MAAEKNGGGVLLDCKGLKKKKLICSAAHLNQKFDREVEFLQLRKNRNDEMWWESGSSIL